MSHDESKPHHQQQHMCCISMLCYAIEWFFQQHVSLNEAPKGSLQIWSMTVAMDTFNMHPRVSLSHMGLQLIIQAFGRLGIGGSDGFCRRNCQKCTWGSFSMPSFTLKKRYYSAYCEHEPHRIWRFERCQEAQHPQKKLAYHIANI